MPTGKGLRVQNFLITFYCKMHDYFCHSFIFDRKKVYNSHDIFLYYFSTVPPGTHGTENMLDDNIMASFEDHGENYKMEDKRETSKDNLTKGLYQSAEVIEGGRTTDNIRPPNENNNNYYANNNAPKPEDAPADSKLEVSIFQLIFIS